MFAAAVSLSHLVKPHLLERELLVLGKETAGWGDRPRHIARALAASW